MAKTITVTIRYFAILREQRGLAEETVRTEAENLESLYAQLTGRYALNVPKAALRVAKNDRFCTWDTPLDDRDTVVFIPPVAGG